MNIRIDAEQIIEECLAIKMDLNNYCCIINNVNSVNVSKDTYFQQVFNQFSGINRFKTDSWKKSYYDTFEYMKSKIVSFEDILKELYKKTGNVEASFSSKMLATINPNKPIWDKYVLENLGYELKGSKKSERIENAINLYSEIEKWYSDFLRSNNGKECIEIFNCTLPSYTSINDVKKIDCFLWRLRN